MKDQQYIKQNLLVIEWGETTMLWRTVQSVRRQDNRIEFGWNKNAWMMDWLQDRIKNDYVKIRENKLRWFGGREETAIEEAVMKMNVVGKRETEEEMDRNNCENYMRAVRVEDVNDCDEYRTRVAALEVKKNCWNKMKYIGRLTVF